jgi:hypothetical protein
VGAQGRNSPGPPDLIACPENAGQLSETATATWGGIEVEWHYQPPEEQPGDPRHMTAALLAHLAVLGGNHDRKDDPT